MILEQDEQLGRCFCSAHLCKLLHEHDINADGEPNFCSAHLCKLLRFFLRVKMSF